ncbi:MAG: hypothetical protein K6G26_12825 [Lachnospiraceae bacterium]|nr:hypothetical protein [Lachnospiraceae bacterium]
MEQTIDLLELFNLLVKHIKFIAVITILVATGTYVFSKTFIPPKYSSSALLYVENKSATSEALSINDLSVAQKLVDTCTIIFTSDTVMSTLASDSRVGYSADVLKSMISVSSEKNTECMRISVECYDPDEATYLTNKMIEICMSEYSRIIKSGTITEISPASNVKTPTSPKPLKNAIIGFLLGAVLASAIVIVNSLLDTSIKPTDDLTKLYDIPVFAEIADFETGDKNKYKYKYSYKYGI